MVDAPTLGLILGAALIVLNLDCNRRVRELQRNSDDHTRWLDALLENRRASDRRSDTERRPRDARR